MKLDKINVAEIVDNAKNLLQKDEQISPALRAVVEMLLMIVSLLAGRLSLNSRNSSKPPSTDPNREKKKKGNGQKKPGGQPGRTGVNLVRVNNPDTIVEIKLDKRHLPRGDYKEAGFESRQVVDINISGSVTEYRAQVLENSQGTKYVADFPEGVTRPIQYGQSVKAHAVYLSQFQLLPYERTADYFISQANIPVSVGSLYNFNQEAYNKLEHFDRLAKEKLIASSVLNADETGININGKRHWLHNASSDLWTYFYPHEKRGQEAMDEIGILAKYRGTIIHDHWKPYYKYTQCLHGLCNAHHIRELEWVIDNAGYPWAKAMQDLLIEINEVVRASDSNTLEEKAAKVMRDRYRQIIQDGMEQVPKAEIPAMIEGKKKRGRPKKSKELNLLERLRDYEEDVLRFMEVSYVPFTNNRGENDIRMTKVQQKISGCFKSMDGAKIFCRVRSYILTAQKHGVLPAEALQILFAGRLPDVFFASG